MWRGETRILVEVWRHRWCSHQAVHDGAQTVDGKEVSISLSGGGKRGFRAQESRRAEKRDISRERQGFKGKKKDGALKKRKRKRKRERM
jgi:hypothetical protein